ncbi:FtsX-like permease family protein [Seohaeicola saemankumensis]|nr:FtsX-like permease family protein [Seohaeicola saemankumensis]MCA0873317.1 FtsX-like permease family protein [Seohaeicola saemankumensis]
MTRQILLAFWAHWRRHPLQLATLLVGLALATGLWSAVQAINSQARASYAAASEELESGAPVLTSADGQISLAQYVALRRAGWALSPVLEGRLEVAGRNILITGVDVLSYPSLPKLTGRPQTDLDPVAWLSGSGRLLASPTLADQLRDVPGLPPTNVSGQMPSGVVLTDIAVAERLLDQPEKISYLLVLPEQRPGLQPISALEPELRLHTPDRAADPASLTGSFHLNLTAFGLLSFAVGLFVVHGTVGLAFEQRRPMFRTLRALGVSLQRLTVLVIVELAMLAAVAALAGLVVGYLVAAALMPDVAATLRGLYGASVQGGLILRPDWVISGLAMALLGTAAASAQALWRFYRMPLLATPGPRAWAAQSARSNRHQAFAGMLLMAGGILAIGLFDGLVAGFCLLAGLMLGSALVLPLVLSHLLALVAHRTRGAVSEWLWADMRAQLPGISLALMALLLALATNIGVGTMVSSFRLTFTSWLDQRLVSELYVTARDNKQGAEIAAWLGPRTDAVLPIRSVDIVASGQPVSLYGILPHSSYSDHFPLLSSVSRIWEQLAAGETVLISEQLARRTGIWTGDMLTLLPDWTLPVGGVYSDYGNPTGQAVVSLEELLLRRPDTPNLRFGIRIDPTQLDALTADLRDAFDLPLTAIIRQTALKERSLAIFDKTFVVTGALNLLTLGVAGFTILTSLLTLWDMRVPQLAPIWALGLTRGQLARLELLRSLTLAALTALLAIPLGLLLAWALLAIINVEAFGWRLPMHLFPGDWLLLFLLALVAATAAALLPAMRLYRIPPSELLKVFADAR